MADTLENNKKLTAFDILDLIFIPFLNTTKNSEEIVKEICGYVSKITKITTKQTKILTWGLWLTTEIFIKNPETLEKVRTMSTLKGQSINEKLHNREIELRQEGIQKGKQEGKQEEKTNPKKVKDTKYKEYLAQKLKTVKTLENEGKTSDEILKTLKTTF